MTAAVAAEPALDIVCLGGGPAGLYFSILMKQQNPQHRLRVLERNRPYDTFGWGVVFSDETLGNLAEADPPTRQQIIDSLAHWDDIEVHFQGSVLRSSGHGFCGIQRKHLLNILQRRAEQLGVELLFETEARLEDFPEADLIIASDGINSRTRQEHAAHFQPQIERRACKFIWLGTTRIFEAFTFLFAKTPAGWVQVHAYRFSDTMSTFIVEMPEPVWQAAGLDRMSKDAAIAWCETLFAPWLDGHRLISNAAHLTGPEAWTNFPRVTCETWIKDDRIVLMGDAAHSAHFSIGSGTKLALEDAIGLSRALARHPGNRAQALAAYQAERKLEVLKLQAAARNSTEWFENVDRYVAMAPEQFAYSLLTRSQRIGHANLKLRDARFVTEYERWFAARAAEEAGQPAPNRPVPPMFTPLKLRDLVLANRVVVSPMATYRAVEGLPQPFHLVHYGARALGNPGLIFTEMTCVSPEARITPGCPGLWTDAQAEAWGEIVRFVHAESQSKICLQLGHAGPKGSTRIGWEGMDQPLPRAEGNWPLLAPSPLPWTAANAVPQAMSEAEMEAVVRDFAAATERAIRAGFDMLELHCAHGYLLSSFLTPLRNQRQDEYGGPVENRLRFPLRVFAAMRAIWPAERPISVRISASDWHEEGLSEADALAIAEAFTAAGADLIDVSAGQTTPEAKPVYGRMFQTPFSDRLRNRLQIRTMAVGAITEPDHCNTIIAAGRADLVALARPHLADPHWTLRAAAEQGWRDQPWPLPYLAGKAQMERALERQAEIALAV